MGLARARFCEPLPDCSLPSHGYVRLDGNVVTGPEPCIVYVPQRTSVDWTFPVSVLDVVLMARRHSRPRWLPYSARDRQAAEAALTQVEMVPLAGVQISQLSGGQQQRVFLARALLENGDVYLLDEPFTGVDVPTQELLIGIFRHLCQQGRTVIFATHDLQQAFDSSERMIILNRIVIAEGRPAETMTLDNLRNAYGASAIPSMIGASERQIAE